ncbi:MAG: transporter [Bacteroidota bacterium]
MKKLRCKMIYTRWIPFILGMAFPQLLVAQITNVTSKLETYHVDTDERKTIYEENIHFEAPNWSKDGQFFIVNSLGKLYKIPVDGSNKTLIETGFADKCNNDHGISPDGKLIAFSHYDELGKSYENRNFRTSRIYTVPHLGGTPKIVTTNTPSFWHGWSPDGKTLLYTALRNEEFNIYAIATKGGKEKQLTFNAGLDDGPEFSHDGKYIYHNSIQSGNMQIWRMKANGEESVQLTSDTYSNWFPHPSPDGKYFVFLSYLEDQGDQHPAMKKVALRLYDLASGSIKELARFTGGQGTINVPSWSSDGPSFKLLKMIWLKPLQYQ